MQLPVVPTPPNDLAPAEVLTTWPEGTFLENLAFGPDGALYVTAYLQGEVHRVDPDGWRSEVIARPGFHPLGIAFTPAGSALLSGHRQPGFDPRPAEAQDGFWRLEAGGDVTPVADADGARFLNGVAHLDGERFACADSSGLLWEVDAAASSATIASRDALIGPIDAAAPLPAANGIKVGGEHLYLSNWVKALIVRAPLDDLAALEVVHEEVIVDDFAFADDGALFGATHMASVVRVEADGSRATIGGPEEQVHGCTACAFGPGGDQLYVITDGGVVANTPEPARLVRLDVGRRGSPLL